MKRKSDVQYLLRNAVMISLSRLSPRDIGLLNSARRVAPLHSE